MISIAAHRLMYFLQLALVAALAGYTLPSVSFAMHGDVAASYAGQEIRQHVIHGHSQEGSAAHDHGTTPQHEGQIAQTADHHHEGSGQDCCSDFCLNLALISDGQQINVDRVTPGLAHVDDGRVFAEPIRLNRPPTFRA